jgi:branched-chain amino acid aminotransferase
VYPTLELRRFYCLCKLLILFSQFIDYFKGDLQAIRLQAVRGYSRAAPGGSGAVKASGNYAPAFLAQKQVKERGYDEILCLDAVTGQAVEEAGASNFFAVFANNTIVTPSLDMDTILPGVTRDSILELAKVECGYTVITRRLTLDDLKDATESFCCGTGAVITPVGCISILNGDEEEDLIAFGDGGTGSLTRRLYNMLTSIQSGTDEKLAEKYKDWIHIVKP